MSCTLIGLAVETLPLHRLPLVRARVPGGFPSAAEMEGTLKLDELLVKHPAATFLMRVEGASMIGAGIHDGDLIVVDRAIEPVTGKIVVAVLDGAFFMKRIVVREDRCFLCSENPKIKEVEVGEWASLDVWGVVTNDIHALK
jgi:DNA polymerase V